MFVQTLRNVFYRKGRAALTIFGISIGVFSLIVLGALAEKITLLVDGGTQYYHDKVIVSDGAALAGFSTTPISVDKVAEIENVEGVARASATIGVMLDDEMSGVSFGTPSMISASDLREEGYESFTLNYAKGRALTADDKAKAVVGSDLVKKLNAEVGKNITLKGKEFEVVGILEKTLTAPDTSVSIPMADAQELLMKTLPEIVQQNTDQTKLSTSITVYIKDGVDPEKLAEKIDAEVENVSSMSPKKFEEQITNSIKIFSSIIYAIAMISLLVGGLSIINTMTMSIAERTHEIGIRKAIGASDSAIMKQFLLESGTIGIIGGLIGILMGWLLTLAANAAGNESGTTLFLVSSRLVLGSLTFSIVLGILSGLYPAWRAARLNPVDALSYE